MDLAESKNSESSMEFLCETINILHPYEELMGGSDESNENSGSPNSFIKDGGTDPIPSSSSCLQFSQHLSLSSIDI